MTVSRSGGHVLALILLLTAWPLEHCAEAQTQRARMLMGTLCTAVADGDTARATRAIERTFNEIARLEQVMSSWREDSELSRMNASPNPFECSADLFEVLEVARRLAEETGGAFDPTIEPLNRVWDLRGAGRIPSREEIETASNLVHWRGIALAGDARRVGFAHAGMAVDLGGIGKGFALDRVAHMLAGQSVERALINLGGEILAVGRWVVDVADPRDRLRPCVQLAVSDAAVSTSGQSERGIEVGEARLGHIIDPRSGHPVPHAGSVTVVATSATQADAYSTALFVMGREHCEAFVMQHPEIGVLWLEPTESGVRGWKWNLDGAMVDGNVEWMN